ncbi:MAG: hypothetical protein ACI9OJ_005672 [Myxococcota bacterium]|jgi:hypothetical protein
MGGDRVTESDHEVDLVCEEEEVLSCEPGPIMSEVDPESHDSEQAPAAEDPVLTAVKAGELASSLQLTAKSAKIAMDTLETETQLDAFYQLINVGRPFTRGQRAQLSKIYKGCGSFVRKKAVFSSRFGVTITGTGGTNFTETDLDQMHEQAAALPPGHVEGMSTWTELSQRGGGSYSGADGRVNMGASGGAAAYQQTFRHEIGHALDHKTPAVAAFRTTQAGWVKYADTKSFVTAVGGWNVPADYLPTVKTAFNTFLTTGTGQRAPDTFENILSATVKTDFATAAEQTAAQTAIDALYATSHPMAAAKQSHGGGCAHWGYADYHVKGDKAYFLNHYYKKILSIKSATHTDIKAWANSAAAFSDKEWFAEVYAEWYKTGTANSGRTFAAYIQTFMKANIDTIGQATVKSHADGAGGAESAPPAGGTAD